MAAQHDKHVRERDGRIEVYLFEVCHVHYYAPSDHPSLRLCFAYCVFFFVPVAVFSWDVLGGPSLPPPPPLVTQGRIPGSIATAAVKLRCLRINPFCSIWTRTHQPWLSSHHFSGTARASARAAGCVAKRLCRDGTVAVCCCVCPIECNLYSLSMPSARL
jgi:hypothetical protein